MKKLLITVNSVLLATAMTACSDPVELTASHAKELNLSPDQHRLRTQADPAVVALVPPEVRADGKLTVGALVQSAPPLHMRATDNSTPIGSEVDLAQLVADKMGLQLDYHETSWDSWPLKVDSGEYELMHANIAVLPARLEKFDITTYRAAYLGFVKAESNKGLNIQSPDDISGLDVACGAGTNQERILLQWNDKLVKEGKEPAHLKYFVNQTDSIMATLSGRIDAYLDTYPGASYTTETRDDLAIAGKIEAGWPAKTLVGAASKRGSGLAPAYAAAINSLREEGTYQEVLDHWGISEEALPRSDIYSKEPYATGKLK